MYNGLKTGAKRGREGAVTIVTLLFDFFFG